MKAYKIIIKTALCGALLTGCSLDREYLNGPSAENFPATQAEAMSGLMSAYKNLTLMDASSTPFPSIQDNTTDIGAARVNTANYTEQIRSQLSTESALVEKLYKIIYKGASRVHLVLDNLDNLSDQMSESDMNILKAELLLVRDYYYELGCQMYGDMVFVDHVLKLGEVANQRMPVQQVIDRILNEDLKDELLDYLPIRHDKEKWGTGRLGRVGAYGLKARIALNWGRYAEAAKYADKALELSKGVYSLVEFDQAFCGQEHSVDGEPSAANLFGMKGRNSDEMIWALQYNLTINSNQHNGGYYAAPRIAGGCSYFGPTQNLIDAFQCVDGKSISESSLYNWQKPWVNRDPRLDLFCVRPGSRVLGYEFQTAPAKTKIRNYNEENRATGEKFISIANSEAAGSKSEFGANGSKGPAGYLWRKYLDVDEFKSIGGAFSTSTKCILNYPLMRLAELYLIRAEANIEMDGGNLAQAKADIETIRNRVKMPKLTVSDKNGLRKALRYERMIELCNEGFRWFDIRRWDMVETVIADDMLAPSSANDGPPSNAKPIFDDNWHPSYSNSSTFDNKPLNLRSFTSMYFNPLKDYLWPIPYAEYIANKGIEQNPYYN